MANALSPTAANIISSLGIRGATVSENLPGFVPVLDDSGKISVELIPDDAAKLAVSPISDVAFVDPYASEEDPSKRTGSITAPFSSLEEAAEKFVPSEMAIASRRVAFVLFPGSYTDSYVSFPVESGFSPLCVYLIGLGECRFTSSVVAIDGAFQLDGSETRYPELFVQNVVVEGQLSVVGVPNVFLIGRTEIGRLVLSDGDETLYMSADSSVLSTNVPNVEFLSDAGKVGYDPNADYDEGTVGRAISGAAGRKIRLSSISVGERGFDIGDSFEDVPAELSGGIEVYDLSERDRMFAECVNDILENGRFTNVSATGRVVATEVYADSANVGSLKVNSLLIGGYGLAVDTYGYLVVSEGSSPNPHPPDGIEFLRDRETGATYILSVSGGRLYLERDEEFDSSDSSSDDSGDAIFVRDADTGAEYELYVENGRLMISTTGGES